jgi:uncharacterized protein (DUF302 family)
MSEITMTESHPTPYGFEQRLPGATFPEAIERVTAALQTEGFGVLTNIDVTATLKKKLGVDMPPYVILGACNPSLAHQALSLEPQIGLLLPCNVVVQQTADGEVVASIADPRAMFAMVDNARMTPIVDDVERRLRRVMRTLATGDGR